MCTWSWPPWVDTDSVWIMVMVTAKILSITNTGLQNPNISLARDISLYTSILECQENMDDLGLGTQINLQHTKTAIC